MGLGFHYIYVCMYVLMCVFQKSLYNAIAMFEGIITVLVYNLL